MVEYRAVPPRHPDACLHLGDGQTVHAGSVRAGITCDPIKRHQQRRRVVHEVEQIIEPAAGIGRRPMVKLGSSIPDTHDHGPHRPARSGAPIFTGASSGITVSFPICVGDPRKGGIHCCLRSDWPRSGPCLVAVDRSRGRGGAPAAQRGRTTSRPARIRRILGRADEAKTLGVKSSAASRTRT